MRNVSLLFGGKFPNSGLAEMVDVTREFGVEMHCGKCEEKVTRALKVCYFFWLHSDVGNAKEDASSE